MKTEHEQLRLGVTTTLDEPVKVTIMRDAKQVAEKLKVVLLPLGHDQDSVLEKLRECAYTRIDVDLLLFANSCLLQRLLTFLFFLVHT